MTRHTKQQKYANNNESFLNRRDSRDRSFRNAPLPTRGYLICGRYRRILDSFFLFCHFCFHEKNIKKQNVDFWEFFKIAVLFRITMKVNNKKGEMI